MPQNQKSHNSATTANDTSIRQETVDLTKSMTLFSPVLFFAYTVSGLPLSVSAGGTILTVTALFALAVAVTMSSQDALSN